MAFSPDGLYLATGSVDKSVKLWEVSTGKEIRSFLFAEGKNAMENDVINDIVYSIAYSPDGQSIACGRLNGTISVWTVSTGKAVDNFFGSSGEPVDSVVFSPDGKYLAYASFSNVMLKERATNKTYSFEGHAKNVISLAYSADGLYIVSSSADKTARLWSVSKGKVLRIFSGHTKNVWAVAISADGKYVVTGSGDNTVRLWDVATEKELRTFTGHSDLINAVAFSPNGAYMVSASFDKTLRLWEAPSEAPAADIIPPMAVAINPTPIKPTTPTVSAPPIVTTVTPPTTPKVKEPFEDPEPPVKPIVDEVKPRRRISKLGVSGIQLTPDNELLDAAIGALLEMENTFVVRSKEKRPSLIANLDGALGGSSAGDLIFEARSGIGASFRLGALRLMPGFGLGVDGLQTSAERDLAQVPTASFRYIQADISLNLKLISLGVALSHETRRIEDGPDEMERIEAELAWKRLSLLVSKSSYDNLAKIIAVGFSYSLR